MIYKIDRFRSIYTHYKRYELANIVRIGSIKNFTPILQR